jgi:hypothetical protein
VALILVLGRVGRRRLAVFRAGSPRERVVAAYTLLQGWTQDVGLGRRPGETPFEYQARLRSVVRFSDGHLERITGLTGQALYSGSAPNHTEAREAIAAAKAAARDVKRHAGLRQTLIGVLGLRR